MQPIVEAAQPYVTTIVTAIVGVLAAVGAVKSKAVSYFGCKLDATQWELLHKVAGEAFAYGKQCTRAKKARLNLRKPWNMPRSSCP